MDGDEPEDEEEDDEDEDDDDEWEDVLAVGSGSSPAAAADAAAAAAAEPTTGLGSLHSMGAGHGLADASSASGGRTFAMPLVCATIEAKTGASSPYAGDSGPALPPANSVGCHTTCGKAAARCAACWPVPEATSKRLAGLLLANGSYLASTAAMGALLRSAEGAHCIFDSQAGSQVSNTRRNAAGERMFAPCGRHTLGRRCASTRSVGTRSWGDQSAVLA